MSILYHFGRESKDHDAYTLKEHKMKAKLPPLSAHLVLAAISLPDN